MAEEQFYTILTNVGKAKIANATLLNSNLTLKTLKVGDGNGTYYNPTEDQEDLKNTVHECAIGAIYIDKKNPNWIISETIIPGSVGGFTIREVGLFDAEGDMIAVGKYPETYKPVVANGASKDLNVRTIFEVSNAENVTLNLDPSVIIATKEDINNLQEQIDENTAQLKDLANPSILINGDFRKPINQRNFSRRSYTGSNWAYGIDRWVIGILDSAGQSECVLNDGYISLKSKANDGCVNIYTLLENPQLYYGETLTASFKYRIVEGQPNCVFTTAYNNLIKNGAFFDYNKSENKLIADGEWHVYTFTYTVSGQKLEDNFTSLLIGTGMLQKNADDDDYTWVKPTVDTQIDIEWAKLEWGSSATSFIPRLYGEELALCQRYYEVIDRVFRTTGFSLDSGAFAIEYPFLVEKRIPPTVALPIDKTDTIEILFARNDTPTNLECFTTIGGVRFTGSLSNAVNRIVGLNFRTYADAEIY